MAKELVMKVELSDETKATAATLENILKTIDSELEKIAARLNTIYEILGNIEDAQRNPPHQK